VYRRSRVSEPYPDVVARFYDAVYAHVRDVDNAWYLEQMTSAGGPVLEIGCGTGCLLRATLALRLETSHGDFGGGALEPDSRELVVVCRREG
jgi:hypothetical protein